ncbi:hypothetical protein BGW37DRAFT_500368 [Umbelopsis sp. PMI_123]|nr:hypothetical protein BGW37DRAFT_500368 [Umbelopsis sp. PMI_123]
MPAASDLEYANAKKYHHSKSNSKRKSQCPQDKPVCLSSAVITVNQSKARNPFYRHAGYTLDLNGQNIAHIMSIPQLSEASMSKLIISPSLSTLTHLKLSNNLLTSIPENIGVLENLMHLDISHNRIRRLPTSIRLLSNLTVLQARSNRLTELPQEIGNLSSLSVLDVSQNRITVLPAEVLRLANLCHLIVTRCPLMSAIPKQVEHRTLSLRETCARTVVRHHIPVDADIPSHLKLYLESAKECSMCGKPCYEGAIHKYMLHERSAHNQTIPVQYTLCSSHWKQEDEFLLAMFSTPRSPSLYHYIAANDLSYQDSNTQTIASEPVSNNHRASLVSPMVHQHTQSKRSLWKHTTKLLIRRPISR